MKHNFVESHYGNNFMELLENGFFSFSFPMKDPSLRVKDKICNLGQNICRLFYVLAVSPYHE